MVYIQLLSLVQWGVSVVSKHFLQHSLHWCVSLSPFHISDIKQSENNKKILLLATGGSLAGTEFYLK